ncbi:MAG: HAD family hydrolase [Chloroflexaceae bacterium]|nr:HAD family hydrolase [Chloroflexaceae bacterium]
MTLAEKARTLLEEWVQSPSLRTHCEAVASCMRFFAQQRDADADTWEAVGILHDMDYERYPNPDLDETGHPYIAVAYLREQGWDEAICRAILSHANYTGVERTTPMERVLFAVDELSGFVTAVALVRPDRNIASVKVSSVSKKLKDKAFAAKVNRSDIAQGAVELGLPLEQLIQQVLHAMQQDAEKLGLNGSTSD